MTELIHRDMTIEEIFSSFPAKSQKLAQAMNNKGLHCVGCHASTWETLEAGVLGHGMSEEDLLNLMQELNTIISEEVDLTTISITPRAAEKYHEILESEGKHGWGLKFIEKAGGCSGVEYQLDYSQYADETDEIFASCGIEIHVPKNCVERLLGSQIDYVDGLQGAGFKISNPHVKSSCSCGTSHSY